MAKSVRIRAPKGKMVVCRTRKTIGVLVRCPKADEHLYEIMDKEEALALEAQWEAEKEAERKANEQPEGESPEQPHP